MSRKRPLPTTPDGSPTSKKRNSAMKGWNASLIPETIEWPPHDRLWQVIGDPASEMYLKSQASLEEYEPAAKRFWARLSLVARGLQQDQLMVVFRATLSAWYHNADKADKIRASEMFESADTWVETQLINKMQAYSKIWYETKAGSEYHNAYVYAKYVSSLSLLY